MNADDANPYIWRIVERFYRSRFHFLRIFERYEERVAGFVESVGQPREKIRLQPRELSGLLSYKELEVLRDEYLEPLKTACHALFRTRDTTEFLDRIVNDIFHELSILKEEHYNVLTYAGPSSGANGPNGPNGSESRNAARGSLEAEERAVLDEVHDVFPQKVHRIHHLYEVALGSLERTLGHYRDDIVLIRSLFLHRDRFVARSYDKGLVRFYELMYGDDLVVDGFRTVGDSFYHSGFYDHATLAYDEGENYLLGVPPNAKRTLDPSYKETREHFRRQKKKAIQHLEALDKGSTL